MSGISDMAKMFSPAYMLYDSVKKDKAPPLGGALGLGGSILGEDRKPRRKANPMAPQQMGSYLDEIKYS